MQYKLVDYLKKLGNLFLEDRSEHYYFSRLKSPLEMLTISGCLSLDNNSSVERSNSRIILDQSHPRTYYHHKTSKKSSDGNLPHK